MKQEINIINSDGCGGALLAFSYADYFKNLGFDVKVFYSARNECFLPIKHLFPETIQIEEGLAEKMAENEDIFKKFKEENICDYQFLIWPDLLNCHKHSPDLDFFKINLKTIYSKRLLVENFVKFKIIYLGLLSNTTGYSYRDIGGLAIKLAQTLPDYKIYLPILRNWASKEIPPIILPEVIPSNLMIDDKPDLINNIEVMKGSIYGIYTDNGPQHIAFHLGQNRLVLDPRRGFNNAMFQARWREDVTDSVSINTSVNDIVKLVKTNLEIPQTNLLPKELVLMNLDTDWKRQLNFKY